MLKDDYISGRKDDIHFQKLQEKNLERIGDELSTIGQKFVGMNNEALHDDKNHKSEPNYGKKLVNQKGHNKNLRLITDSASFNAELVMLAAGNGNQFYKNQKGDANDLLKNFRRKMKVETDMRSRNYKPVVKV